MSSRAPRACAPAPCSTAPADSRSRCARGAAAFPAPAPAPPGRRSAFRRPDSRPRCACGRGRAPQLPLRPRANRKPGAVHSRNRRGYALPYRTRSVRSPSTPAKSAHRSSRKQRCLKERRSPFSNDGPACGDSVLHGLAFPCSSSISGIVQVVLAALRDFCTETTVIEFRSLFICLRNFYCTLPASSSGQTR